MSLFASVVVALAGAAANLPPPQPPYRYTVRAGDTLITLGDRLLADKQSWREVERVNAIRFDRRIPVGTVLSVPRHLLKFEAVDGRVAAFRGDVRIGTQPVAIGAAVREGMMLATGANASVTVALPDGSRFSLPSQTRLGIARLRRVVLTGDLDRVFTTLRGRGEWNVSPAPTPDSRFMVTTPVSVSAVRGTGFRVGYDANAVVGVVEGNVGVSANASSAATALPKGKGVAVAPAGVGKPVDLLAAPEWRSRGLAQTGDELAFEVAPVAGAKSYVFEIGTDAAMADRLREMRGTGPGVRIPALPDGSYFVRATATDRQGIDGFSTTARFERRSLVMLPVEALGRGMRFRWRGGGDDRNFRFALYRDAAGTQAVVDRAGVAEEMLTITELDPGTYWWRVTMMLPEGGEGVPGKLQSFTVASGN